MSKQTLENSIIILLTEKGYTVVSNGEVLDNFDTKRFSILEIANIFKKLYPKESKKVLIITEGIHEYENAVIIAEGYISNLNKPNELTSDDFDVPTQEEINNSNNNHINNLKQSKMKNQVKVTVADKARQGAIVTTNILFGSLHFILQSAADVVAETEGAIVKKLGRFEESSQDIANRRREQTARMQKQALEAPKKLKQISIEEYNKIMNKKSNPETSIA